MVFSMINEFCPLTGTIAGAIGSSLERNLPKTVPGLIISSAASSTLVVVTVVALKYFCGISICGETRTGFNTARTVAIAFSLSVAYSIAINSILQKFTALMGCFGSHTTKS